jgi:hypothetical protein
MINETKHLFVWPTTLARLLCKPLALALIRLSNAAASLHFASRETQEELDFNSATAQGVCFVLARQKE